MGWIHLLLFWAANSLTFFQRSIILLLDIHDLVLMRRYEVIKSLLELGVPLLRFSKLLLKELSTMKSIADGPQHLRLLLGAQDNILLGRRHSIRVQLSITFILQTIRLLTLVYLKKRHPNSIV
jgi:hypothetical protein